MSSTRRAEDFFFSAFESAISQTVLHSQSKGLSKTKRLCNPVYLSLSWQVLSQLNFFRPNPKVVKQRIHALIDREYLERDPDNQQMYKYLA
jgi:hypothetical protein